MGEMESGATHVCAANNLVFFKCVPSLRLLVLPAHIKLIYFFSLCFLLLLIKEVKKCKKAIQKASKNKSIFKTRTPL